MAGHLAHATRYAAGTTQAWIHSSVTTAMSHSSADIVRRTSCSTSFTSCRIAVRTISRARSALWSRTIVSSAEAR